jgi:2-dehydropantoate 2-reductase
VRALIVGAGAIGQYLAARLKAAGHDAVLLARPGAVDQLAGGYTLAADGTSYRVAVPVASTPSDAAVQEPFELIVTAVKAFATPGAIDSIRAIPACAHATVLVAQNGLGSEEACEAAFGADRVIAAALTTAVEKTREGISASRSGGLSMAPVGSLPHNWLIAAFEVTHIKIAAVTDWRALKWSKLCINLQANAVCAILDWPPEQVYADRVAFSIERRCLLEAVATMNMLGITPINLIDFPVPLLLGAARTLPEGILRVVLASRVAKARGGKLPSLLIDTRAHRPQLEVDALNGAVAARAQACGVPAPANAAVTRILDGIVAGSVNWGDYRGKPAALAAAAEHRDADAPS